MNCPKCGKELAADERFCENCGTPRPQEPVQPAPAPQSAPAPRPAPAPAKKSPVGLIVILAVVIVAAAAIFLGKGLLSKDKDVAASATPAPSASAAVSAAPADTPVPTATPAPAESTPGESAPPAEGGLPMPESFLSADDVIEQYNWSQSSFENSLGGTVAYVKGIVADIQTTGSGDSAHSIAYLKARSGNSSTELACHFDPAEGDIASFVQVGDYLEVVGTLGSAAVGPRMSDCVHCDPNVYAAQGVEIPEVYTGPDPSEEYLFPSDTQYITRADLIGRSREEVVYIRNEIFARYGYSFKADNLRIYFAGKSWYHENPNVNANTFGTANMNDIERDNIDTIMAFEREMGWK